MTVNKILLKARSVLHNPLPAYMEDCVRANWTEKTARTALESEMGAIKTAISVLRNKETFILLGSEEFDYDEAEAFHKTGNDLQSQLNLLDRYNSKKQYAQSDSIYHSLLNKYGEENLQLGNYAAYTAFLSQPGINISALDSAQLIQLISLAGGEGKTAKYAQNILCFFYEICLQEEMAQKQAMIVASDSPSMAEPLNDILYKAELYPNPAKDFTSLKWEIAGKLENCVYEVYSLAGTKVAGKAIDKNQGEIAINTKELEEGYYVVIIKNNNQVKKSINLIVR